ncbi:MAG: tetratricopeptide repeat protein [Elusimicrobia bacterium]|nr:tetratricopeptide repeat protein [Candidatus Liberimonas magnetica]
MKKIISLLLIYSLVVPINLQAVSKEAYQSYLNGLIASRSGDFDRAIKEYEHVLKIDDKAIDVYRQLTSLYWQVGRIPQSFYAAQKLEELSGKDIDTKLFLGNFYLVSGNPNKARELWESILEIEPDTETALLYLAAYYSDRNLPQAIYYWKKFIEKKPDSAPAYFQLGTAQEKLGQLDDAVESFKKAISLQPNGAEMYLALANIYEKQENFTEAINEFKKYLELAPDNVNVLLYLGGLYYRLKMYEEAQGVFLEALKIKPQDTNINFWLGIMAEHKKDWKEAIKYFEAIREKEENAAILTRLSFYYSASKNMKESLKCLKKVAKLEPNNANSYYLLGLAYFDMDNYKDAEKMLIKALELKPDFDEIYFHFGVLYDTWKKFDKAELMLKKSIELDPKNSTALNYLAYSYIDRGINLTEAESLIKRALALGPDNGAYIDSLGWLYFNKGEFEKAEKYLIDASEKINDPVVFEHVGDVSMKLNKTADAWDAYQKSSSLDQKNKNVLKKIKALEKFVLPKTVQRKLLKRAIGNLLQVSSLRSNFSITGRNSGVNFYSFGTFQYKRPARWRVDILGNFLMPHVVIVQNKGLKIYPKDLQENDSVFNLDCLDRVKAYFNTEILAKFDSDRTAVSVKRNLYTYRLDAMALVIDSRTGAIKEYKESNKMEIAFRKQVQYEGLYLPLDINIYLPDKNISAQIKIKDFDINNSIEDGVFTPFEKEIIKQGENKQ